MNEMTDRRTVFRAAIAGFIGTKLKKLPKDKDGNYAAATDAECADWLDKATRFVSRLHTATHVLKATHGDANGSDVLVSPHDTMARYEIGTHSLGAKFDADIVASSAAYLGASSFFRAEVEGHRFADWIKADDTDFRAALHPDTETAGMWMAALQELSGPHGPPTTHPMAKQLYWLAGDTPQDDTSYHLLQPMFASSLAHAVHANIQDARFGENNKTARQAKRDHKPADAVYRDYRDLVTRKLGGTKPQNISQLNSERHGVNYLLASLPPPAWKPRDGVNLLKFDSVFNEKHSAFFVYGEVRQLIRDLADFLKTNPDPNKETRETVNRFGRELGEQLMLFGAAIRGRGNAGWTRHVDCSLLLCEQLWLDPERTELPERDDPEHPHWHDDDLAFNEAYERADWADEVAGRFGRWLNDQLRKRSNKLATLGEAQMRHFARQAILDVAWPIPRQRRAKAGAA